MSECRRTVVDQGIRQGLNIGLLTAGAALDGLTGRFQAPIRQKNRCSSFQRGQTVSDTLPSLKLI
jgi:hypothetical protein